MIDKLIGNKILILVLCLVYVFNTKAQQDVLTFGFEIKPILPAQVLGVESVSLIDESNNFSTEVSPKTSIAYSFLVRRGISNMVSFETGINYIRRSYQLKHEYQSEGLSDENDMGVVSYEIPFSGIVFVQISSKLYMNVSAGLSLNWLPTDVFTFGGLDQFTQIGFRNNNAYFAYLANIGWEYRTKKSGYFYLGASMHTPFNNYLEINSRYEESLGAPRETIIGNVRGNFLSINLRYYFHETKLSKQKQEPKL